MKLLDIKEIDVLPWAEPLFEIDSESRRGFAEKALGLGLNFWPLKC